MKLLCRVSGISRLDKIAQVIGDCGHARVPRIGGSTRVRRITQVCRISRVHGITGVCGISRVPRLNPVPRVFGITDISPFGPVRFRSVSVLSPTNNPQPRRDRSCDLLSSESSSEAGKESEKTTGDSESDATEADPTSSFNSEEGSKLGPGVFEEVDSWSSEGSERSERHSSDEMEGEQIREEDGNTSKDDEGSRASISMEDAELGVKEEVNTEEENVQEAEESSQIFDSTEGD